MKRSIEGILCVLVLAGSMVLISGCGKQSSDAAGSTTEDIVELSMFQDISWLSDAYTVWETGRVTGEIMKKTGVKLNITRAKTDDHEQIQLLIASDDLPDLTVVDYNGTIFGTLSESDMVLDVLDLVQKHAPEMYDTMGKEYWDFYKSESGVNNFYANWAFTPTMGDRYAAFLQNYPVLIARSDIWEEFGKPDISTPEKLRAHLLEVQKKYPDVKPLLTGANEGLGLTSSVYGPLAFLRTSFGIEKYYEAADGTIKANYNHPEFEHYLLWLNDLYRDGMITREEFSGNDEQIRAKREQGNVYMYIAEAHNIKYPPAGNPDAKYEAVPPFSTFSGTQQIELSWLTTFISKKSKHPDAAIKLLSYMNSLEGDRLAFWGQDRG
jgi:putative aldouronate transport system substrate-binding protein